MAGSARSAAAKHAYRMFAPSRGGGGTTTTTRGPGAGTAEEFDESDVVWGAGDSHSSSPGAVDAGAGAGWARPILGSSSSSSSSSSRAGRNKTKQHPAAVDGGGGAAGSLPMNIPDWQKILGVEYRDHHYAGEWEPDADEGGGGGAGAEMVPPHELAWRGRAASLSVHEGIGRTLKGRDLSRVRDAVWKKTGFED